MNKLIKQILKEELTKTDKSEIEKIARSVVNKELDKAKFNTKVGDAVKKNVNKITSDKKFEDAVVKIIRNALVQYHKELWVRRNFWKPSIKNRP